MGEDSGFPTGKRPFRLTRRGIFYAVFAVLLIAVLGPPFLEGRRAAEAFCAMARPGQDADALVDQAHKAGLQILDDRAESGAPDTGHLVAMSGHPLFRRMCVVDVGGGKVLRASNEPVPD